MSYSNRLRSPRVAELLNQLAARGDRILDVGGGFGPYAGSTHILDIAPFDATRLQQTAWGGQRKTPWTITDYTQFDICGGPWPFANRTFDIGYASGVLEDLRDPVFVLQEMQRVCREVIIESPNRLCEQTRGIEHQRWTGFWHHRWMLYERDGTFCCQRKTPLLNLPGCHRQIPPWRRVDPACLAFLFHAPAPFPVAEVAFWQELEERDDLQRFVRSARLPTRWDPNPRRIVYRLRQKFFGAL